MRKEMFICLKIRKEIPELEKTGVDRKKFVRYEEGAKLYSIKRVMVAE